MFTYLFNCFSLKTCDFPMDWVIKGQSCIWITAKIRETVYSSMVYCMSITI